MMMMMMMTTTAGVVDHSSVLNRFYNSPPGDIYQPGVLAGQFLQLALMHGVQDFFDRFQLLETEDIRVLYPFTPTTSLIKLAGLRQPFTPWVRWN